MQKGAVTLLIAVLLGVFCVAGCGNEENSVQDSGAEEYAQDDTEADEDQAAADEVAAMIDGTL